MLDEKGAIEKAISILVGCQNLREDQAYARFQSGDMPWGHRHTIRAGWIVYVPFYNDVEHCDDCHFVIVSASGEDYYIGHK